jgi:hypothetical protein
VGNDSRNVSEAEEAAMANYDEEQQELEQQSQTFFPLQRRRQQQYPDGRSSGVESLGYCKITL